MPEAVLAVDLGTTRVKAGVVGLDGELIALAHREYGLVRGAEVGWVEQDAGQWWAAARAAIQAAASAASGARVVGICVGGQGPSIVPVDDRGRPLANALIWMDRRTEPERHALGEAVGHEVSPYSSIPKAMWIREHLPDVHARTRWFLQAWDHIAFQMTGVAVASSFRGAPVFPAELVSAAGLDPTRFPRPLLMGEVGGTLREGVARECGLEPGLPVAGGVNDSTAAILGTGIVRKGLGIDYGGTSGGLGLAWDVALGGDGLTAWPLPAPGLFICGGPLAAAGRSFAWLLETFGYGEGGARDAEAEAASVPAGSAGLVFLPYLAGERTPVWDEQARGVLFGLTERHARPHIARAVLEGVAFALRHVADRLRDRGATIDEIRLNGGQGRSALWARIKADVIGTAVVRPRVLEGALMGEAILAGVGAGRLEDPIAAAQRLPRMAQRLEPDPALAPVYAERYAVYRELYPRLRELMPRAAAGA